jgi:hypothetical protein
METGERLPAGFWTEDFDDSPLWKSADPGGDVERRGASGDDRNLLDVRTIESHD